MPPNIQKKQKTIQLLLSTFSVFVSDLGNASFCFCAPANPETDILPALL